MKAFFSNEFVLLIVVAIVANLVIRIAIANLPDLSRKAGLPA